jgi:hypothetical protein
MVDTTSIAVAVAAVTLGAIALSAVVVLGAIAVRFANRNPGRRWGTAVAFLFGIQVGGFVVISEGDPIQRAVALVLAAGLALGLLRSDRRVQAGAFICGLALPWTVAWGYVAVALLAGAVDAEPVATVALLLAGSVPAVLGLALAARGDPPPPDPDPAAPPGRPGSRRVGIVARVITEPERLGPMPISEIATFVAEVASVIAVGLIGLPQPLEFVAMVVVATLVGSEVRLVARPTRARRAYEAFSWLGEWEFERVQRLTGRDVPTSAGAAEHWLERMPDRPDSRWIRVEILALLNRLDEARRFAETMPEGTPYERFERTHALDYVDWMAGGPGDPGAVRAAAAEIDPADADTVLRAEVAIAVRDAARRSAAGDVDGGLEPFLAVRDRLGSRADGQLRRALWGRYLPVSAVSSAVLALIASPPF